MAQSNNSSEAATDRATPTDIPEMLQNLTNISCWFSAAARLGN
jgi:hypothetical protein